MKTMGWNGGGLGKAEQGITRPIQVAANCKRIGFGYSIPDKAPPVSIPLKEEDPVNLDMGKPVVTGAIGQVLCERLSAMGAVSVAEWCAWE